MAMEKITRTFLSGYVQTHHLLGIPVPYLEYTTINQKLDILPDQHPDQTQVPRMRYYMIGNGGHKNSQGAGNIAIPRPRQHSALDGAGFNIIPFVLREPAADLSQVERQKYALRKVVNIDGNAYVAYYAKRIDMSGVSVKIQQHVYEQGSIVTVEDYVPDNSTLNPTPMETSPTGINVLDGRYVVTSAKLQLTLNRAEIDELLNVARIMYDSEEYAIISEIQLVSGVDRVVQATSPGQGTFNFNEVIGAQVLNHINVMFPLVYANEEVNMNIEVGSQEPLFKLTNVNTEP